MSNENYYFKCISTALHKCLLILFQYLTLMLIEKICGLIMNQFNSRIITNNPPRTLQQNFHRIDYTSLFAEGSVKPSQQFWHMAMNISVLRHNVSKESIINLYASKVKLSCSTSECVYANRWPGRRAL